MELDFQTELNMSQCIKKFEKSIARGSDVFSLSTNGNLNDYRFIVRAEPVNRSWLHYEATGRVIPQSSGSRIRARIGQPRLFWWAYFAWLMWAALIFSLGIQEEIRNRRVIAVEWQTSLFLLIFLLVPAIQISVVRWRRRADVKKLADFVRQVFNSP